MQRGTKQQVATARTVTFNRLSTSSIGTPAVEPAPDPGGGGGGGEATGATTGGPSSAVISPLAHPLGFAAPAHWLAISAAVSLSTKDEVSNVGSGTAAFWSSGSSPIS